MLPESIANQSVVRLRGTVSTDAHNNDATTWGSTGPTITGCSVQPMDGSEYLLGRDAVVSRWTLYAPDDADILSSDRIKFEDVDYDIDGSVQKWTDPTGSGLDHKVALLKRVEG